MTYSVETLSELRKIIEEIEGKIASKYSSEQEESLTSRLAQTLEDSLKQKNQ